METSSKWRVEFRLTRLILNRPYNVPLKEFTNLARTIAESAVAVPSDIIDVTRRAIIARKRCASWFQKRTGGNHNSNTKHSHFIDVLEATLALLGVSGEQNGT